VKNGITIDVITGVGYQHRDALNSITSTLGRHINIVHSTNRISDLMIKADLAFTSGGRTVYELAALCVPTVVLCQNERETCHTYISATNGVWNLGLASEVSTDELFRTFRTVQSNRNLREQMAQKASSIDFREGKHRVMDIINRIIKEHK
jgi:spore coat polysaccharide biosynthesis predicted glycosyltransferase SpsG